MTKKEVERKRDYVTWEIWVKVSNEVEENYLRKEVETFCRKHNVINYCSPYSAKNCRNGYRISFILEGREVDLFYVEVAIERLERDFKKFSEYFKEFSKYFNSLEVR